MLEVPPVSTCLCGLGVKSLVKHTIEPTSKPAKGGFYKNKFVPSDQDVK